MAEQITQTEIIQRILACKAALGLDTLPNTDDLKKLESTGILLGG